MNTRAVALLLLPVLVACAPRYTTPPTVPPGESRVEDQTLPPDAQTEPLPEGIPDDQRVEPMEEGQPAPFPGVLLGEGRSARLSIVDSRYDELRVRYEQDRRVWSAQRELYETRLALADKAIRDLQPSWWQRNALSLGILGGVTLGVLATVAAASATN